MATMALGCGPKDASGLADKVAADEAAVILAVLEGAGASLEDVAIFDANADGTPKGANSHVGFHDGHVTRLTLSAIRLPDPAVLSSLPKLSYLRTTKAGISAPLPCAALPELSFVSVGENPGFEPAWLESCDALRSVELMESELRNLDGFPTLPELRYVHLGGNPLEDLSGFPVQPELDNLTLQGVLFQDFSSLASQPKLERIVATNGKLESTRGLERQFALENVFLRDNQIEDTTALDALAGLGERDLKGNPVADKQNAEGSASDVADGDGKVFPKHMVGDIQIPPPTNPWVHKIERGKGSVRSASGSCKTASATLGGSKVDCSFKYGKVSGFYGIEVEFGRSGVTPAVRVRARVGSGRIRVYMPYYSVQQYVEATPGTDAEVSGVLETSTFSAGRFGVFHLIIESVEGPAEDVAIEIVSQ
jgi:hypothetical protein